MTGEGRAHQLGARPLASLCALLAVSWAGAAFAGTFTAFGPERLSRGVRRSAFSIRAFEVRNPDTQYFLRVLNTGVSSATLTLNGEVVVGAGDLNPTTAELERAVDLQSTNVLTATLRGVPGSALFVSVIGIDEDPPAITAEADPPANARGWHDTDVTVRFGCDDPTSGIASCAEPVLVAREGADQEVCGSAVDLAGNRSTACLVLNIDKTPPLVTITSPPSGSLTSEAVAAVSGRVADAFPIVAVTCNGLTGSLSGGEFRCEVPLEPGPNTIAVRAEDAAGNSGGASVEVTRQAEGACRALFFSRQIVAADDCFRRSLLADPANQELHFFRALTRLLRIVEGGELGPDPDAFTDSLREMLEQLGVSTEALSVTSLDIELPDPLPPDSPRGGDLQEFLRGVLIPAVTASIEEDLSVVPQTFALEVTRSELESLGIVGTGPVEVDGGDLKMLEAALRGLEGNLRLVVAYDLDVDVDRLMRLDPLFIQEDILDPHPDLLELTPDAAQQLARARDTLEAAVDSYFSGSNFIRNLEDDLQSDDVITIAGEDFEEELELRTRLGEARCALRGSAFVGVSETEVSCDPQTLPVFGGEAVDLTRFFDAPFGLRGVLPPFELDSECGTQLIDIAAPAPAFPFPDPTLNGVLPNLTQEGLIDRLGLGAGFRFQLFFSFFTGVWHLFVQSVGEDLDPALLITGLRLEDGSAFSASGPFGLPLTLPARVCPGGEVAFEIQFNPPFPGCFSDIVILESNDADEPALRIPIEACSCVFCVSR